jgi:hypothetical protein
VFSFFCPSEVKHFGTSAAYVAGDGQSIGDIAFEPIESALRNAEPYTTAYRRIRERYTPLGLSMDYGIEQRRKDDEEAKYQINNGLLHLYFDYLDNQHPYWRLVTGISFLVGFIALGIPSLQIFLRVMRLIVRAIW